MEGPCGVPEIRRPLRSLAENIYGDIRRRTKIPKGGHFAALEQPELLAHEVREAMAVYRRLRHVLSVTLGIQPFQQSEKLFRLLQSF